jgi:hypothetical protein
MNLNGYQNRTNGHLEPTVHHKCSRHRWQPVHTLVALAILTILAWHCWGDYSAYLRDCQHSEFIAYMMGHGANFSDATRAWEKTQGLNPAE